MQNERYAGFFVRLCAYFIDLVLINFGTSIVGIFGAFSGLFIFTKTVFFSFTLWDVISKLILFFYFVILTYTSGQTIGKMALGIKVINPEEKLNIIQVIVREVFAKFLSGIIMGIGYIMIGPDSQKRALHDHLSDTRVVYTND